MPRTTRRDFSSYTYKTKNRDKIGPLRIVDEIIESSEGMCTALNEYFLSVFTQEDMTTIPEARKVFRGRDHEKLRDITITREEVQGSWA